MITPQHVVGATTVGVLTGHGALVHPVPNQTVRVEKRSLTRFTNVGAVIFCGDLFQSKDSQRLGQIVVIPYKEFSFSGNVTRDLIKYPVSQLKGH